MTLCQTIGQYLILLQLYTKKAIPDPIYLLLCVILALTTAYDRDCSDLKKVIAVQGKNNAQC